MARRPHLYKYLLLGLWQCIAAWGATTIDCKKVKTLSEKTICSSKPLLKLDNDLSKSFSEAVKANSIFKPNLRVEQSDWNEFRSKSCGGSQECFTFVTKQRLKELQEAFPRPEIPWSPYQNEWLGLTFQIPKDSSMKKRQEGFYLDLTFRKFGRDGGPGYPRRSLLVLQQKARVCQSLCETYANYWKAIPDPPHPKFKIRSKKGIGEGMSSWESLECYAFRHQKQCFAFLFRTAGKKYPGHSHYFTPRYRDETELFSKLIHSIQPIK